MLAVASFLRTLWDAFNSLIAFTANLWQNIDGLVFTAVGIYLLIRLASRPAGSANPADLGFCRRCSSRSWAAP